VIGGDASSSGAVALSRSPKAPSALPRFIWAAASRAARARGSIPPMLRDRRDGLVEPRRPAFPLAKAPERKAEIILGHGPIEWHTVACSFLQGSRNAVTASSSFPVPLSRSPSVASALPRFIWVVDH